MCHIKNGWFFKRNDDGSVIIRKGAPTPTGTSGCIAVRFSPEEWASVVAAVSARGDTMDVWNEALALHNKPKED